MISVVRDKFPLRIHCWGGFGSQLNALGFALEIKRRALNRKLILVFHTGGVTRRDLEIQDLIPNSISWEVVDDFENELKLSKRVRKTRKFLSKILFFSRVIVIPSGNADLAKIKPWTISSRGHYSYFNFSPPVLSELANSLRLLESSYNSPLVLHYRLGDLLALDKGFTDSEEICRVAHGFKKNGWLVLTDSPAAARNILSDNTLGVSFDSFLSLSPKQVIQIGFSSEVFIGTSSKISIWIALFRIHANRGSTFLPSGLQNRTLDFLTSDNLINLKFYP